jgi:hypothetical protein
MAGGNNHLLYFIDVYFWTRALGLAGVIAGSPFAFVRITQWMNALAASGCVVFLWILCRWATGSLAVSIVAAAAYAFSHAFILHATSTAEPMVGLFWSFLSVSVVVAGLATSSRVLLIAAGVLLLLAMATYESMVLIGPAELILICYWDDKRQFAPWFLAGCVLGASIGYLPAYAMSGTTSPRAILRRFLDMGGGEHVYGGFRLSKVFNLPLGFANAVAPSLPHGYGGLRWLLIKNRFEQSTLLALAAATAMLGWIVWTLYRLVVVWSHLQHRRCLILSCCALALVFDCFPLIFWDPLYDKLWLQPIAVVILAWSVIFEVWRRHGRSRPMRLLPETLLMSIIVVTGLMGALKTHRSATPCLDGAQELAGILRPNDLLLRGWDSISLLYSSFWGHGAKTFDVPAVASSSGPRTVQLLHDEIARTMGNVYSLGILDMPENDWTPFLGDKAHLPYRSLDPIRTCAKRVASLSCSDGTETLWKLPSDCR